MRCFYSFLSLLFICCLWIPTEAGMVTEDYEGIDDSQTTFTHYIFNHSILPVPGNSVPYWEIGTADSHPTQVLWLYPAMDEITFDLNAGEWVDYVEIEFVDWGGGTYMEVTGTNDTYKVFAPISSWGTANTTGLNLGEITKIELFSNEGTFDNIKVNVVPEPATMSLLTLGAFLVRRKRKS